MVPVVRYEHFFKQRPVKTFRKKYLIAFLCTTSYKKIPQRKARLDFKVQGHIQVDRFVA